MPPKGGKAPTPSARSQGFQMVEEEATQEPSAPEDAAASPSSGTPAEAHDAPPTQPEAVAEASPDEPVVSGEELVATEDAQPEADASPREPPPDWGHLRGLQSVESPAEEVLARADYAEQLAKELEARATQFANAVDESIVLSSEGVMRWLGDPVARVIAGETLLAPRAVLLADEALTGEDRARAENRATLWLAAHIRKLLGPLIALVEGTDLPEAARTLGAKIAEALGVLERDRVRAEVKTLDQTARGALRKLGVRFGSQYIYAPILLKPAARGLCSLLWTLRRGAEPGADRLLAFASAGRTSFANEGLLSPDSYRVAGFRLSGERVVRVDIIERLSDLIRAAIPDHMRTGSRAPSEAYGFVVSPQMTSLTGCSGEAFSSILRSLGFEPHKVSKAAFEAANRRAPTEPIKPAALEGAAEASAPTHGDAEGGEPPSAELVDHEALVETAGADHEASHSEGAEEPGVVETDVAVSSEEAEVGAEPALAATAEAPSAEAENEPENVAEPVVEEMLAAEPEASSEPTAEAEVTNEPAEELAASSETAEEAPSGEGLDAAQSLASPAADEAPTSSEEAPQVATADEEIEIWRPAPRRPRAPPRPHGANREAASHGGKHREQRRHGRQENPAPAVAADATAASASPPPSPEPHRGRRPDRRDEEARRRDKGGEDTRPPREERRPNRDFGPRRESRPVQVDPDSPFAKLAALKPLLERRDKRT